MDRKTFITSCGFLCAAGTGGMMSLIQSCAGSRMVSGTIAGEFLVVSLDAFISENKDGVTYRNYIVVNHENLQYPVCVYRFTEKEYSALLMKCTHQGNELTVYGDKLHCAAHGSEFDKKGIVTTGPSVQPLRTFPVHIENNQLKISLKAS